MLLGPGLPRIVSRWLSHAPWPVRSPFLPLTSFPPARSSATTRGSHWHRTLQGGGALPNTPCAPSAPAAKRTRTNRAVQQAELMPAHTGSLRCQSKNIAIEEGAQKWSPTGPRALGAKRGFVPQDRPVGQRKGGDALALLHPLSPTAYRQTGQGALGDS